jgi:hypothetical protein
MVVVVNSADTLIVGIICRLFAVVVRSLARSRVCLFICLLMSLLLTYACCCCVLMCYSLFVFFPRHWCIIIRVFVGAVVIAPSMSMRWSRERNVLPSVVVQQVKWKKWTEEGRGLIRRMWENNPPV